MGESPAKAMDAVSAPSSAHASVGGASSVAAGLGDAPVQQSDFKDRFYRFFQDEVLALQEQISQLEGLAGAGGERQDAIDHCLAGITRLSSEVSQAAGFLPAYDQRSYAQVVKALSEQLHEKRSKIAPRPKFSFKTMKNNSAISLKDAVEIAQQKRLQPAALAYSPTTSRASTAAASPSLPATPGEVDTSKDQSSSRDYNTEMAQGVAGAVRKPSFSRATMVAITGQRRLHIILPASAAHATSAGSLTRLTHCVVDLSVPTTAAGVGSPFAGLALQDITASLVVVGQVAGAAHITGVTNAVLVVAARQVRMHECRNVDVYLQCASRPIIEDCSGVRFAPLPSCYASETNKPATDLWDQVDDFKWLKTEHSPNWEIIPVEKRTEDTVWTNIVPGGPSLSVDDILKAVGVLPK